MPVQPGAGLQPREQQQPRADGALLLPWGRSQAARRSPRLPAPRSEALALQQSEARAECPLHLNETGGVGCARKPRRA